MNKVGVLIRYMKNQEPSVHKVYIQKDPDSDIYDFEADAGVQAKEDIDKCRAKYTEFNEETTRWKLSFHFADKI